MSENASSPSSTEWSSIGIPPRLAHCSRKSWIGEWPFDGSPVDVVLLHGPVGSGKSHLAAALCLEAVKQGAEAGWRQEDGMSTYSPYTPGHKWSRIVSGVLFRDIQATVERLKPNHEDADKRLKLLRDCAFLAFDDLGSERLTDWTLDRVSLILRTRYDYMRPTVVTTNLSPSELGRIDPRLASRLCSGVVHKCSGRDRRLA